MSRFSFLFFFFFLFFPLLFFLPDVANKVRFCSNTIKMNQSTWLHQSIVSPKNDVIRFLQLFLPFHSVSFPPPLLLIFLTEFLGSGRRGGERGGGSMIKPGGTRQISSRLTRHARQLDNIRLLSDYNKLMNCSLSIRLASVPAALPSLKAISNEE